MEADGRRLLKQGPYGIYAGSCAAVIQTASQMVEATGYTRLLLRIAVLAFAVNVCAALWAFSFTGVIEDHSLEILVFKTVFYFTAILSPYTAVSVLFPKKLGWYLLAIICVIMIYLFITLFKNRLKASIKLAYEKVVDAAFWMRSFMTNDDQVLPITYAPTARIIAEEHNLRGSGSSPSLPWLSAEEQPNLNGFTNVPL